ncbi:hypothetical protein E8E14_007559 [Neopestalotiopsis sp. 37M]|nr:hypothetical protein E8E14_007559 [Neopestalotiopsis sp. 37M]
MSYMVSEYIIRPALQQVRRFSRSSVISETDRPDSPCRSKDYLSSNRDDAISETEEGSPSKNRDGDTSPPVVSPSPLIPHLGCEDIESEIQRDRSIISQDPSSTSASNAIPTASESGVASASGGQTVTRERDTSDVSMTSAPAADGELAEAQASSATDPAPPVTERPDPLPEDDGMGALRKRILEVQALKLPATEQARLMHLLLMENYNKKTLAVHEEDRPISPSSSTGWEQKQTQGVLDTFIWNHLLGEEPAEKFRLTEEDIRPTFAPLKLGEEESEYRALGCEHYKRNVKSECSICGRWYTCRFCHDKVESHKAGEACTGASTTVLTVVSVGWEEGSTCNACLNINFENRHKCIERLLDCDCPICGEYMFNTTRGICHMKCGHTLHKDCWDEHIKHAYKCPICSKSIVNMETQFRRLDIAIETQPMPEKFQDTRAIVSCNDCSAKTTVKYHWLGLKCAVCQSYNTSQVQILGEEDTRATISAAVPEVQVPESLLSSNADLLQSSTASIARDIPRTRRRHSSNLMQLSTDNLNLRPPEIGSYVVQERFARSVSPTAVNHPGGNVDDSDEDKEDMIGLWSRVPRSITSNDDEQDEEEYDSDDDSVSSTADDMDEDDAEDEEDEINLFGHR